jgi:CheY-like chemotaxis protein
LLEAGTILLRQLHHSLTVMTVISNKLNIPDGGSEDGRKVARPLVLVVEDHDDTRFMLRYLMENRGCTVVEAGDGESAVRLTESMNPDLILMDSSLPKLDGLTATRRIRELPTRHGIPIIMLSGQALPRFRDQAILAGSSEVLAKPLDLDALEMLTERHLQSRSDEA